MSDDSAVRVARWLRWSGVAIEATLVVIVAGSTLAFGCVHPLAYRPLWLACGLAGVLILARTLLVHSLRGRLGRANVALDAGGRSLETDPDESRLVDEGTWCFDLRRPLWPRGPLLWPGVAFMLCVLAQLLPWPWRDRALTVSAVDTARGLAFVAAAWVVHLAAAAILPDPRARRRFRGFLVWFGFAIALGALVQLGTRATAIYGMFTPREGGNPFGPFVNRNHFAGYMLLVAPLTLAALARALWAYRNAANSGGHVRERLVALSTSEGAALVYACLPAFATLAALMATTSRGGIVAFSVSLLVVMIAGPRSNRATLAVIIAALAAMTVSWFGLQRVGERFAALPENALGRSRVWAESIAAMDGLWLTGSGFNTYAITMSRVAAWRLPANATPWPDAERAALESGARVGYRLIEGDSWYREAHNDYVQVLVETGLPGLAVALWAAVAVLRAVSFDRWVFGALLGMLLHAFVDFDFQIPALSTLFVVLAAWRRPG